MAISNLRAAFAALEAPTFEAGYSALHHRMNRGVVLLIECRPVTVELYSSIAKTARTPLGNGMKVRGRLRTRRPRLIHRRGSCVSIEFRDVRRPSTRRAQKLSTARVRLAGANQNNLYWTHYT